MKLPLLMNVALVAVLPFASFVTAAPVDSPETTIVVIESMDAGQSFQVSQGEQVRIPCSIIAGSTVSAQVSGPAVIVAHNRIVPMKENTGLDGEKSLQPLIGSVEHEYLLQPTGPGDVTVTMTTRSPIPRTEPVVKTYHFTVE